MSIPSCDSHTKLRVKVKANPKMDIFCDISKLILTTYSHLIHIRTLDGVQLLM